MNQSLDINALSESYASGTQPQDIIRDVYARIRAAGTSPVWISLVREEDALQKARCAPRGPLYGVPFAVKDNINVAGLPTTCACPAYAATPERSACVVSLLEAAGAILIGKTNMDQFATGLVGVRSPYGIPRNVFNSDYISGGSSSGSAVAVASGLVSFALGTDTAGSGRVPAAFNNIVGLKPTKGLISTRGVVPACRTQDVVSVFALSAGDAQRVAAVAAAFDPEDPFSRRAATSPGTRLSSARLRAGIPSTPLDFFGDGAYAQLYDETIARMAGLGAEIVPVNIEPFRDAAALLYSGPWVAERLAAISTFAHQSPDALHEVIRTILLGAKDISAVSAFEGIYRLAELTRAAEAEWQKMDVLLLPTAGTTYKVADVLADPIRLNSNLGAYTNFVNLMDLSAISVPAGFRGDGLPFGVTLIGRAFDDSVLSTVGDQLHRALGRVEAGHTGTPLSHLPAITNDDKPSKMVAVAVVGAHLNGQPLHWQLTERNARFIKSAKTAIGYSFYALANTAPAKPGLVFDGDGAGMIDVEIWEMGPAEFGSFVALIPSPLGIGTLSLADGSSVKGFLCEPHAIPGATNITEFGGWRAWLEQRT